LPLGTRLDVRAPYYRAFSLSATIEAMPRRAPADIAAAVRQTLRQGFALTSQFAAEPRAFGVPVTTRDVAALIRHAPGVRRIGQLALSANGAVDTVEMGAYSLPRLDLASSSISVTRMGEAGAP
jgi:D-aminopeptidase